MSSQVHRAAVMLSIVRPEVFGPAAITDLYSVFVSMYAVCGYISTDYIDTSTNMFGQQKCLCYC